MIRRRRIHRKKAAALALLAFGCLTIYCLYEWKVLCSNGPIYSAIGKQSINGRIKSCDLNVDLTCFLSSFFIDTLCSHFANGKAHGNLCRQFCVTRALQPESCQTFHVGKEVVFSAFIEESQKVSTQQIINSFFPDLDFYFLKVDSKVLTKMYSLKCTHFLYSLSALTKCTH